MSEEEPSERPPRPESEFIDNELTQIQAYVDATNAHIKFLETIAGESAKDNLADIKRGLKDAHRGLERLESRFSMVGDIKTDVWQTYRRVRELEERLEKGEPPRVRPVTRPRAGTVRAVTAARTASVSGVEDTGEGIPIVTITSPSPGRTVFQGEPRQVSTSKAPERPKTRTPEQEDREEWHDAVAALPNVAPFASPPRLHRVGESYPLSKPQKLGEEGKRKPESEVKRVSGVSFPVVLAKSRDEVLQSIAEEEKFEGAGLNDPRRKREGSAEGRIITQAVMTGNSDPRVCLPHLAYIKVHEVRDLKTWLKRFRYVRESKRVTGTEKILHLLTLLQVGCRFESVAVLFSRTPKEVVAACQEVFEGLLEMHSETMLPTRSVAKRYLYPEQWHIVHNSGLLDKENENLVYYQWTKEAVYKVLITLNVYIGRYRSQGRFALEGDILDWGRYIDVRRDEDAYNVVRCIERLQSIPPTPEKPEAPRPIARGVAPRSVDIAPG